MQPDVTKVVLVLGHSFHTFSERLEPSEILRSRLNEAANVFKGDKPLVITKCGTVHHVHEGAFGETDMEHSTPSR